jgi:peroxiredoxin-like protein
MKPLPHRYEVDATAENQGPVELRAAQLKPLISASPEEFDGPGNLWSPETLLVGAVADCFVLTFKAIAATAKLHWSKVTCKAEGKLDRADDGVRFTDIVLNARLEIAPDTDYEKARRVLEKAEKACLVGNSLKVARTLHYEVVVEELAHL